MLKINDLRVNYGGIEAVKGISFEVPEKSIVTLIGANGAGKSTSPAMARRVVLLPAPLAPMRVTMDFSGTSKLIPFTASIPP